MTGFVVARYYRAPEVMLNWQHYDRASTFFFFFSFLLLMSKEKKQSTYGAQAVSSPR